MKEITQLVVLFLILIFVQVVLWLFEVSYETNFMVGLIGTYVILAYAFYLAIKKKVR